MQNYLINAKNCQKLHFLKTIIATS